MKAAESGAGGGGSCSGDNVLGMNQSITRRDFLNASLLASGSVLLNSISPAQLLASSAPQDDWTGYGGVGDYANSNGNTRAVFEAGHQIRDKIFENTPANVIDSGETYDCVIVGGGISGLAAALIFQRQAGEGKTCLVIDNHPIFGGEAKRNEFLVDGQRLIGHQGSALFQVNYPHSFIERFYQSIGLKVPRLEYQKWGGPGPEIPLTTTPYLASAPYGLYFGVKFGQPQGLWLTDPWGKKLEGAPISAKAREELLRYQSSEHQSPEQTAQVPQYRGDAISRRLDTITLEDHLIERHRISRETVRTFLSDEGGGFGLGPDALSGYTAYAFDGLGALADAEPQMFPDGNSGIARLITKTLIPESITGQHSLEDVCRNNVNFAALDRTGAAARIRLDSTAVWVKHEGDPAKSKLVNIAYTRGGKVYGVKARSVVMAGGSWTTKHIVRDLPDDCKAAYAQFYRSPCMVANVAVRNWRFLYKMGISGCQWFEGLGSYMQVRKLALCGTDSPTIGPDSPVVLTIKVLYSYPGQTTEQQGHMGRGKMISTPFRGYERQIRQQLTDMFARSGFDATRDIAGIILNRWGHAYASPAPGFYFGKDGKPAPGELLRAAPFGRIAFANVDLSGMPDHKSSIIEADRAVGQLLDQVLSE
ncbi:MAG TPA: FAD/NAD(P)-binding protein [Candidatus Sulfotelmatobacter sp.]|jgi:spermidine dehydrogenase|nr:FAD/NAD(P)-binding protein [Candidatus Sulfotelmatobacter sp.]